MSVEKSRNGFYTITFFNRNNMDEDEITQEFSTVGKVCKVAKHFQRIFVRYKEKEEAEKAIAKYGHLYNAKMANNNQGDTLSETKSNYRKKSSLSPRPSSDISNESMDLLTGGQCTINEGFHLIVANLPKEYTVRDVQHLVEEVKPLSVNELGESRVFKIKACHIVLESRENLTYLINKLDGFVICGEKLTAVEAKNLLEWRNKI